MHLNKSRVEQRANARSLRSFVKGRRQMKRVCGSVEKYVPEKSKEREEVWEHDLRGCW